MQNEVEKFLHVFYLKKICQNSWIMHLKNVSLSFFRQTLFFLELNQQKFKIVAANCYITPKLKENILQMQRVGGKM